MRRRGGRCVCFLERNIIKSSIIYVVYFNQLSGTARTQILVEKLFKAVFNLFCSFKTFFSDFTSEIKKKTSENEQKKTKNFFHSCLLFKTNNMQMLVDSLTGYHEFVFYRLIICWKRLKKVFWPAVGWVQHPKAGQNTQQI